MAKRETANEMFCLGVTFSVDAKAPRHEYILFAQRDLQVMQRR
jgi:hypothetical protein